MAGTPHSLRNGIIYILPGGAVLFLAVALGIRVRFVLKSDTPPTLTPDNLPNQSLLRPGDVIPELPVLNLDGRATALNDAIDGKPALGAGGPLNCPFIRNKFAGHWSGVEPCLPIVIIE